VVAPAIFADAERYHGGGIAGLRPGEVPAILTEGETVLPRGAGGAATVVNVTVNNHTGAKVERTERRRADGGREITLDLRDENSRQIARGDHDVALQARYGLTPKASRR
jgi:hypothetical protein